VCVYNLDLPETFCSLLVLIIALLFVHLGGAMIMIMRVVALFVLVKQDGLTFLF
jgi:hypothetical protein